MKRLPESSLVFDLKGTEFEMGLADNGIYTQNSINRSKNIYLLSEREYAKLLKILEDDFAWEQYEKLVDNYFNMRQIVKEEQNLKLRSNNNLIQEEKKQLEKAVITTNYLVEYISSKNSPIPQDIFNSLKTSIMAVNIDIVDYLEKLNNLQIKKIS